ncbi:MAG TPA: universal stress protein [Burkholderiales bacterium]|nr:universal stress protein [Burkholderiales bacterium]
MLKLLVAVDGSENANRVVDYVIRTVGALKELPELHVLNVQRPLPYGHRVESVIGHEQIRQYHHEAGMAALKSALQKLDAAKLRYQHHIGVGEEGDTIARYASEKQCDEIVMGTRGMGSVSNLLLGSCATKVIHLAPVPVVLVK